MRVSSFIFICSILGLAISVDSLGQATTIRPKINRLVDRLRKEEILHLGAPVGEAGVPETNNKYYKRYVKLGSRATDNELISLTNDSSKTIKLYAFSLLSQRENHEIKNIFLLNLGDSSEVWATGGCTGVIWKVNSFMLNQLRPDSNKSERAKFSIEEFDGYVRMLGY
jgi:hypothetical protein